MSQHQTAYTAISEMFVRHITVIFLYGWVKTLYM
jgi:hypothetical protein